MSRGDRLIRLLNMFFVIQASPGLSAPELPARCQVSERQCYLDLRTLQDAGIPIYYDNGYRVVDGFVLKNISLTLDEALSLIYGIKLIERQQGVFSVTGIKEKLLSLLPEKLRGEIEEIEDKMEIQIKPGVDYSKKEELFRRLNGAVRENKQLHMEYASLSSKERTTRIIEPYRLVFKDKFWYIVAYCHRRREVRLFRIDRIKNWKKPAGILFLLPILILKPIWVQPGRWNGVKNFLFRFVLPGIQPVMCGRRSSILHKRLLKTRMGAYYSAPKLQD